MFYGYRLRTKRTRVAAKSRFRSHDIMMTDNNIFVIIRDGSNFSFPGLVTQTPHFRVLFEFEVFFLHCSNFQRTTVRISRSSEYSRSSIQIPNFNEQAVCYNDIVGSYYYMRR